jgi:uncharacterized protein YecT (DUF1311 family)
MLGSQMNQLSVGMGRPTNSISISAAPSASRLIRRRLSALSFCALATFTVSDAGAEWYGPDYRQCAERPTAQLVACVKARAAHWDRELNRIYQQLMVRLAPQQRERLRAAQRLWIQHRDANCGSYAAGEGSIASVEAAECLRAMTQLRYNELSTKANPE